MRTKTLLLLVGLPASGKSTYAFELMRKERRWKRVSRDDLRLMLSGVEFDPKHEGFVTKVEDAAVEAALRDGYDVIIDATHLNALARKRWLALAERFGDVKVISKNFDITLKEAHRRNDERTKSGKQNVPPEVIERMYDKYIRKDGLPKELDEYFPNPAFSPAQFDDSLPFCIVSDLDGTLADNSWRNHYDATDCARDPVICHVADTLRAFHAFDDKIIFVTGREEKYRAPTEEFLARAGFSGAELIMRTDNDRRRDSVVKKEALKALMKRFNVRFCIEDRPRVCRMLRYELGLNVFQVADVEF